MPPHLGFIENKGNSSFKIFFFQKTYDILLFVQVVFTTGIIASFIHDHRPLSVFGCNYLFFKNLEHSLQICKWILKKYLHGLYYTLQFQTADYMTYNNENKKMWNLKYEIRTVLDTINVKSSKWLTIPKTCSWHHGSADTNC